MNLAIASTVCLAATALLLGGASTALAQASPRAEALFRNGKQLMGEGKLAEACTAFEGSERLEHNIATVLSLADCREKAGQLASAWALFLQADSQTRADATKAMMNRTAKQRAKALEPKLSYLTINVPDESRVSGLVITRDDAPVDLAEWNRAIPIDGGSHVVAGKASGHESWSTTVVVAAQTDHKSVEVPRFKSLLELVNKPVAVATRTALQPSPPPPPTVFPRQRIIAIWIVGLGVVAGGTGVYFGLDARNLRDEAVATCPPSACTTSDALRAQSLNDNARRHGLYANIGFGVAAVAVIAGGVMWFTGAPESRTLAVTPSIGEVTGATLVGQF